ncbi:hypothetical protein T03_8937, partial [Trichinella britovi]
LCKRKKLLPVIFLHVFQEHSICQSLLKCSAIIDFAKLDGEQFCRLHSGHLRRSVPNGSNLHDARNCVSAIRRCKEEGSFAESCRNVVEF